MKKNNNKGFTLIETLVVSTFIVATLVFLYTQFTTIKRNYDYTFKHNTVVGTYNIKVFKDYIMKTGYYNALNNLNSSSNGYVKLECSILDSTDTEYCNKLIEMIDAKTIIFTKENLEDLKNYLSIKDNITGIFDYEFYNYIKHVSIINSNEYRIIIKYNNNTYATIVLN